MLERILVQLILQYGFSAVKRALQSFQEETPAFVAESDEWDCLGDPFPEEQLTCRPSRFRRP